jgi:hypothetical protein
MKEQMMSDIEIKCKGLDTAKFYYSAQRYFNQLNLLTTNVTTFLTDQGWKVDPWNYNLQWGWELYSFLGHRCVLPKRFFATFESGVTSGDRDKFGFSVWFFNSDPTGELPWVPTAYFYRTTLKEESKFEFFKFDPQLAQIIRGHVLTPSLDSVFLHFSSPWPESFAGADLVNALLEIDVVPFPLAAITNSEELEMITSSAVGALSAKTPSILKDDNAYLKLAWGL